MNFETYELLKNFRENGVERRDVGLVVNCIVCIVNLAWNAHVFIVERWAKNSKNCFSLAVWFEVYNTFDCFLFWLEIMLDWLIDYASLLTWSWLIVIGLQNLQKCPCLNRPPWLMMWMIICFVILFNLMACNLNCFHTSKDDQNILILNLNNMVVIKIFLIMLSLHNLKSFHTWE